MTDSASPLCILSRVALGPELPCVVLPVPPSSSLNIVLPTPRRNFYHLTTAAQPRTREPTSAARTPRIRQKPGIQPTRPAAPAKSKTPDVPGKSLLKKRRRRSNRRAAAKGTTPVPTATKPHHASAATGARYPCYTDCRRPCRGPRRFSGKSKAN
ncbi:hypothetical protein TOPH_07797 [Tolypocladium ophioglossoides CBS 100239]|uniref:Uncharacterized protein n=1 Tax=Tolypocladium ophioglossoides (strain CBS 100239) TaxID=1163406 RepID=A0A0L0N1B4_TOLOC|nr:hypothetical protein TOPH_07797 [Tolypocladium ophioglossoides CBS 100239]